MQGGPLPWSLAIWATCLLLQPAVAQPQPVPPVYPSVVPPVTLEEIPAAYRDRCRSLLEKPTYRHTGDSEVILARAPTYVWLLDNPDQAVTLWRLIGAQCTPVERRSDWSFGWKDDNGSDLRWDTIVRHGTRRVWYAEGKVKPALLIPGATVRALVVIHHQLEGNQDAEGRDRIRHRVEFVVQTDSHLLTLAARLMGASTPRMAEQFSQQVQMFFGGLAWYLDSDPDRAEKLIRRGQGGR